MSHFFLQMYSTSWSMVRIWSYRAQTRAAAVEVGVVNVPVRSDYRVARLPEKYFIVSRPLMEETISSSSPGVMVVLPSIVVRPSLLAEDEHT